jgi:oligopeptide transport system permease protein
MIRFLLARLGRVIAVLLGATVITFLLMHAVPGNPWADYSSSPRMMTGLPVDKPLQRELMRRFGLDLPLWRQFTRYIIGDVQDGRWECGAVCGNLGPSTRQRGRSVQEVLFEPPEGRGAWESRFGYSVRLVLLGSIIAVGLGIPLGLLSATRSRSAIGRAISVGLAALVSIPNFVLGLLGIILLASWLKLIPVLPDWGRPSHWVFPAIVLAAMPMASIARVTHATLVNTLSEDYVRTARAKGLTPARVLLVHVLRNALNPIITFLGPTCLEMFIGLIVVENLYAFPGFGREYADAILQLDYPMIMGLTLLYATGIALVQIGIEVLAEIVDPRLRTSQRVGAP